MGRDRPYPAEWTVRQARDAYLEENGFTVAAYDDRFTDAKLLGITFKIPNTKRHRWALMWHDLHHAITGYGTDPAGEGEISAWETRRGLRPLGLYVGAIVIGGIGLGMLSAPRRTMRAWKEGRRRRGAVSSKQLLTREAPPKTSQEEQSLFHEPLDYEACLEMTLGDLRERLGVPRDGLYRGRRGLHAAAPEE